ncbi:MAG: hypothetical protein P8176_03635 [Gammaproteobacteria bacterium]
MLGERLAIRKYLRKLPPALSKRYGGSGPYTPNQVAKTVDDLKLNERYIRYAYLMYCERSRLDRDTFTDDAVDVMLNTIALAAGGGILNASLNALRGGADGSTSIGYGGDGVGYLSGASADGGACGDGGACAG